MQSSPERVAGPIRRPVRGRSSSNPHADSNIGEPQDQSHSTGRRASSSVRASRGVTGILSSPRACGLHSAYVLTSLRRTMGASRLRDRYRTELGPLPSTVVTHESTPSPRVGSSSDRRTGGMKFSAGTPPPCQPASRRHSGLIQALKESAKVSARNFDVILVSAAI
jgi:hypothetical protein